MEITHPQETARQISGVDPDDQPILSVLTTRAYRITRDGRCVVDETPAPLVSDPVYREDNPDILEEDSDLYPWKPNTDVVIVNAEAHASAPTRRLEVKVTVGAHRWKLLALGDRRCYRTHAGKLAFTDPYPFERMPVTYDRAYGGRDDVEEKRLGEPLKILIPFFGGDLDEEGLGLCQYPRNPAGVGYLIRASREALETLRLPNLEDPRDRLTPERLPLGDLSAWTRMPVPAGLGWYHHTWFPRSAYVGIVPEADLRGKPLVEVARQWAPPNVLDPQGLENLAFAFRFSQGAHPGLQVPHLRGDETIVLEHLDPKQPRRVIELPGERPLIWTDGRKGKLNPTAPVIHTIRIDPASQRVTVVWRGSAPALRGYSPDELKTMPFRVAW